MQQKTTEMDAHAQATTEQATEQAAKVFHPLFQVGVIGDDIMNNGVVSKGCQPWRRGGDAEGATEEGARSPLLPTTSDISEGVFVLPWE
jgi:hypothetical protein